MSAWAPDPGWTPLAGAEGQATVGVWRASGQQRAWVVKRLHRPSTVPAGAVDDPRSFRWWRREIAVVESGVSAAFRGLVAPDCRFEVDEEGVTLWSAAVDPTDIEDGVVAAALGHFAALTLPDPGWFTQGRLRDRVTLAAERDSAGQALLALGEAAPAAMTVWQAREALLARLDSLPQVLSHGDALPRNLLRHDGETVTAIDWSQLGYAPVGADLVSYSMWVDGDSSVLLKAYVEQLSARTDYRAAQVGLDLTAALIAVSRAIRTAGTPSSVSYQRRAHRALPHLHRAVAGAG